MHVKKNSYEKDRYDRLKREGLCVWCGVNKAALKTLGEGPEAKFLKYCQECRGKYNVNRSERRLEVKIEVLSHYGPNGLLGCCWESCTVTDPDMLTLDHENNDGNVARKGTYKGGISFYMKVKRDGYPTGLATLCHNHQWKKEISRRREDLNGTPSWREKSNTCQ
jgi:hypothetical protein